MKEAQKNRDSNRKGKVNLVALNAKLKEEMSKYREENGEMEEEVESEEQRKKRE